MTRAKIHLLPTELRNQIAAGEVVERPASVVKELVENALDANATEISVVIEDGGQSLISVQDNGIGIPKDELELAVTRHATSKLQTSADLSNISSYGFRGEALPSIASVSRFRIVSKTQEDSLAGELCVNFGDIGENAPASLRQGTLIEVRDLFFNIPARLKFLKNPATELKRVTDLFVRLALGADGVSFSFVSGSRTVQEFFRFEDKKERLAKIWSGSVIENLIPVDYSAYGMRVFGYISNPKSLQSRPDRVLLYVNGRPVNDKLMLKAIRQAYAGKIISRDYPQCLLFLELDPKEVDVNVHPAKSEVRFRDERALFALVAKAVESALAKCPYYFSVKNLQDEEKPEQTQARFGDLYAEQAAPKPLGFWGDADRETRLGFVKEQQRNDSSCESIVTEYFIGSGDKQEEQLRRAEPLEPFFAHDFSEAKEPQEKKHGETVSASQNPYGFQDNSSAVNFDELISQAPYLTVSGRHALAEPAEKIAPLSQDGFVGKSGAERKDLPYGLEYLGQVAETYLLLKKDDKRLLILDQHAVHERILYDEMKKGRVQIQNLLCPLELPLQKCEESHYAEVKETLQKLGFEFAEQEKEQGLVVQILAIPLRCDRGAALGFIKEILAEKMDDLDSVWIRHACKTAIKANTPLDRASAVKLVLQWLATDEPDNCPHGRPSVLHFDSMDLEKMFKRKA